MKIAVMNFSGNVGKSTIARHLLLPRMPGAKLLHVESINADAGQTQALRGRQFAELQAYLQTVDRAIVDIGASNVEELIARIRRYTGSQEDFDTFVVPTVPSRKQQEDTIATLAELASLGVPASRIKLVFNRVEHEADVEQAFTPILTFLSSHPLAVANPACKLGMNELYERIQFEDADIASLAKDPTDYKRLIAHARDPQSKLALADKLANRRLALGVIPELDRCFATLALNFGTVEAMNRLVPEAQT